MTDGYSAHRLTTVMLRAAFRGEPVQFRFTRREWVAISVIVAVVAVLVLGGPLYFRHYNSCALCRLGRCDYRCLGVSWSRYEETECTPWYREHVERTHEHVWVSASTETERNIFGSVISIGDGDPRSLFGLTPLEQVEIYKHIPDPDEARRVFRVIGADDGHDPLQHQRVRTAASTIKDWVNSGFAEAWNDVKPRLTAGEP